MEYLLAGGLGTLCAGLAGIVFLAVVVVVGIRLFRSPPEQPAVAAPVRGLPDAPDVDGLPLRDIADPMVRRDTLLDRIETSLGYLGRDLEVVKGSKGDLRFRGQLHGQPAALDIDAEGRVTKLRVDAAFGPGKVSLRPDGAHVDPEGLLSGVNQHELATVTEQMGTARLVALHIASDGLVGDSDLRLYDLELHEELQAVGQTLSSMENTVRLWQERGEGAPEDFADDEDEPATDVAELPTDAPSPSPLDD